MKTILGTAMVLGAVITLGTTLSAGATVTQPIAPDSSQPTIILAHGHGGGHWGHGGGHWGHGYGGYYGGPGYFYGGPGYYDGPVYDNSPGLCVGPLCLF